MNEFSKKSSTQGAEVKGKKLLVKEVEKFHVENEAKKLCVMNEEKPALAIPPEKPGIRNALILLATFNSVAFTDLQNSLGNLTACKHKGQNVVKKKAKKVGNPKTIAQQMQRKKFPALVELSFTCCEAIAIGLRGCKLTKQTVENCFVKLNKEVVTVNEKLELKIDFEHLILSKGKRALPKVAGVSMNAETNELTLTFETGKKIVSHANDDDLIFCCLVEKTTPEATVIELGTRSSLGTSASLPIPNEWDASADNIAVYLFCTDKKRMRASKTLYLNIR